MQHIIDHDGYILTLALRGAFGGGTIDKDDELLNDVVLRVAEVIFIVESVRENHEIITFTYVSKH